MLTTPYTDRFHADTLANGGATVDLTKHDLCEPGARYYVGRGKSSWVHTVPLRRFTPTYLAMLVAVAKAEGFGALGTWVVEGENASVIIEPTILFDKEDEARSFAVLYQEHAYFDSLTRKTIWL